MKKTVYPISPDYKKYSKVNPPLNRFALFFVRLFGLICVKRQKSDRHIKTDKYNIPVTNGKIRATIFSPKAVQSPSILVFYHGGGFCYPSAPYHFSMAKKLSLNCKCKVAIISYRLSPKYKFPTQLQDCFNAYLWVRNNAQMLNINPDKIILGGDSAGGNLAVGVCLTAKEKKVSLPIAQMLLYPAVNFDENLESMQRFAHAPMCSLKDIKKYQKLYLNENQKNTPLITPTLADLTGLPTTYIETAEFDVLKSGALLFADKLASCKVQTEIFNTQGTIHAFDIVPKASTTQKCMRSRIDFLTRQFNK